MGTTFIDVAHCQLHRDDVAQGDTAGKVKMADQSGTELSEEKEAEIELKKRQKRPWEGLHKSGKIGITPELPETLGFYDISAVRREQRELSAGNCRVALLITVRHLKCFQLILGGLWALTLIMLRLREYDVLNRRVVFNVSEPSSVTTVVC